MQRLIFPLLAVTTLLTLSSVEADACPAGQTPHACAHGLCDPYVGPPPLLDADLCCDESSRSCTLPGPRGCPATMPAYHCDHGELDPTNGQVQCYFEVLPVTAADPPPQAADDDLLCCNDNGCTIHTVGCEEDGGSWLGHCYGDMLILEDGTAYCYPEGEC